MSPVGRTIEPFLTDLQLDRKTDYEIYRPIIFASDTAMSYTDAFDIDCPTQCNPHNVANIVTHINQHST